MPRPLKQFVVLTLDLFLAVFSVWLAYYLRLGYFISILEVTEGKYPLLAAALSCILIVPIFLFFKLYSSVFRFGGLHSMVALAKATAAYGIIFMFIITVVGLDGVPRTIGLIQPTIFIFLLGLSRVLARLLLGEINIFRKLLDDRPRVLIYGAESAGIELASVLKRSAEVQIVGFLHDDVNLHGNRIEGLPVYDPSDVQIIAKNLNVTEVMLALPLVNRRRRSAILQFLNENNMKVRSLPSYSDLALGRVTVNDILELSADDVLGRDVVLPNKDLMSKDIEGKVVVVTGAGGSIGSELCYQILLRHPKKLLLIDHSEFALFTVHEKLLSNILLQDNLIEIFPILGSVNDVLMLTKVFEEFLPETVFHAAAYKHVPLVEANKFEGIKNNVFGTYNLAQIAIALGVKKFVLISTDKAVRPTNIMGASKRLAEMILQALSSTQTATTFAMVRFGNVLDSSGSVMPLFRSQIRTGGPLTLTHPDVTRYFMTVSEAAELVIQAAEMTKNVSKNVQVAPVYLLDMGEPVKIIELARSMIKLSGMSVYEAATGDGDIEIKITGLRPGEKLFEELLIGGSISNTSHPKIKVGDESFLPWSKLQVELNFLQKSMQDFDEQSVVTIMSKLVTGFVPNN